MKSTGELFEELVAIMARLRNPQGGCPWDLEQTHESLTPYVIEEAYEVVDAIQNSPAKLPEELGDLLLQAVFHAQLGREAKSFDINTVLQAICDKLIRRHPHVFGDTSVSGSAQVLSNWEQIKKSEKKGKEETLSGVPKSLPGLMRAQRLGEKAQRVGFEWHSFHDRSDSIFDDLKKFAETHAASEKRDTDPQARKTAEAEFGELLFALAQWGRKAGFQSEELLAKACTNFSDRFHRMEKNSTKPLKELLPAELGKLWTQAEQL